jgi:glutamate racemase
MDFVERGDLDGEDLRKYLVELLFEYRHETVDAVVLGCTHYPFVKDMIQKTLGEDVLVFDGGEGTAKEMKRRLGEAGLLTSRTGQGHVEFRNSLNSEEKLRLCRKLFEM